MDLLTPLNKTINMTESMTLRHLKCTLSQWIIYLLLIIIPATEAVALKHDPGTTDTITFRLDMTYMVANGRFHPGSDSLDIMGTMNNWQGSSLMQQVDTSYIYNLDLYLTPGKVYQYKYRINRDSAKIEVIPPDSANHFFRCPDTNLVVTDYYEDYNPSKIKMTFNCDLYYQVRSGHFTTTVDYLDVAGNFNNNGAYDVLFADGIDSMYSVTLLLDTSWANGIPLKFKFRFNGNWTTSELKNDSNRIYSLNFPSGSYTCWYDNIDPNIPAIPFAYNLSIQDSLIAKKTVTGIYTYEDYNLKPEGKSLYQWYRADSIGGALTAIDTATRINYTLDSLNDIGKYIVFEVTPVTYDSIVGLPVHVFSKTRIVGVGEEMHKTLKAKIFPNPSDDQLVIETSSAVRMIDIYSSDGRLLKSVTDIDKFRVIIDTGNLPAGLYLIRMIGNNGLHKSSLFVVQH